MKKITAILCVFTAVIFIFTSVCVKSENKVKIYFADRRLHMLVPSECSVYAENSEEGAEKIISVIENRNSNEIINLIPKNSGITVSVHNRTACVDIPRTYKFPLAATKENEQLFIYQIVNSLTFADGIEYVTFTVGGKCKKRFLGFLDMREIFSYRDT